MNITKEIGGTVQDPKKSNLLTRILSALIMLPIAIYIILNGGLALVVLLNIISVLILYEWNGICEKKPFSLLFVFQALCASLMIWLQYVNSPYLIVTSYVSLSAVVVISLISRSNFRWALLGYLYAIIPTLSFLLILKNSGGVVILWVMIVIWSMDTGAYFAGKNIGGPKMAPKISPNKTWSGLIGGTITAVIFGGLYAYFQKGANIVLFENATILLLLSGFLAVVSQVGDLAESAIKRKFNVKDSGAIIPGHGGIMDRVDGVLFVAPAVVFIEYLLYV